MHGGISDPILSSLRVFINAHSRSIVSSVYDSLQHPHIILAKNGPTKTYLLYMYLSSLTEWSHSLAWFERPADNRKVLCSNHNGTTKAFRLWKIAQQMCICSIDSSSSFCATGSHRILRQKKFRPMISSLERLDAPSMITESIQTAQLLRG